MVTNNAANIKTGAAGTVLQGAGVGSALTFSTPTYPSASGTSRKILVSNGTNNVYSTETWAVPGTSGNVLTSDGTNWTSAAASGGVLLSTGSIVWSNVALKAGTSITLVAAQGAGTIIIPVQAIFKLVYGGTNAFSNAPICQLNYSTVEGANIICNGPQNTATAFWEATANFYAYNYFLATSNVTISASQGENKAVSATLSTALLGNAAGDNVVHVNMIYYVLSI